MAEEKHQKAARSVHLYYKHDGHMDKFYNEVVVKESHPGSYFCAIGFNRGYFGIQELYDGDKQVIFSVWDPEDQDEEENVNRERRVKVVDKGDPGNVIGRFGNEGTGGKSKCPYEWKVGEKNRFVVQAVCDADTTTYSAAFYDNRLNEWRKMATLKTITEGKRLRGIYSFVEDFHRNYKSYEEQRVATFTNCWRFHDDNWAPVSEAKFSADGSEAININARGDSEGFCMETGGATENTNVPLGETCVLGECPTCPPDDLPELS